MSHLIFNSAYDFYKLPEPERVSLIGRTFRERVQVMRREKVVYTTEVRDTLYFPVGLHKDEFNYSSQQGVLLVTPVRKSPRTDEKWFKVAAFSPDDLDLDLEYDSKHVHLRQAVIEFIRGPMRKHGRRYREMLEQIQKRFKAGEITG